MFHFRRRLLLQTPSDAIATLAACKHAYQLLNALEMHTKKQANEVNWTSFFKRQNSPPFSPLVVFIVFYSKGGGLKLVSCFCLFLTIPVGKGPFILFYSSI